MVVSDQFAFVSDKDIRRNVSKIKSFMIEMKIEFEAIREHYKKN